MSVKYLFAVFLATAFLMTGCSSKTDSTARKIDDTMKKGGEKVENMLDGTNANKNNGFDPTFGNALNDTDGRFKNTKEYNGMDYIDPNMSGVNGVGATRAEELNNGMASSSSTGTNY